MADLLVRGTETPRRSPTLAVRRSRTIDALALSVAIVVVTGVGVVRATPSRVEPAATSPVTRAFGSRPAYDDIAAGDNLRDADRGQAGRVLLAPSAMGVRDALRDVVRQLCPGALKLSVREESVSNDFRRADFAVTARTYYNSIKERVSAGGFTVHIQYNAGQYVYEAERRTGECRPV